MDFFYILNKNNIMKIIVIGDVHGRTCWKDIIHKEEPSFEDGEVVIFLGDYVSTHDNVSSQDQINNLKEILDYKESNSTNIILLRGNHDMQHLGYYWAKCSGRFPKVEGWLSRPENKERFLNDTQWIYIKDNIIFSHAGISTKWMELNEIENLKDINKLEPSEIFGFTPCKMSDYYGISPTQPPTWIRPQTLIEYMPENYIQVVGHTPTSSHKILKFDNDGICDHLSGKINTIWLCDALPYEYLVIENELNFKTIKIYE